MDESQQFYGQEPEQVKPTDFAETPEYQAADNGVYSQEEQAPEPDQGSQSVLNELASKGYDVSEFRNDEDLISETEARYAATEQAKRDLEEHQEMMRQQSFQQSQAPPQDAPVETESSESNGQPKFDASWANLVEQDESGRYVVRDEYVGSVDPSIADRVNKYVNWRQERSNQLIEDPVGTILESGLNDQIEARVRNAVSQELNKGKVRDDAQSFIQENANVLYVTNPETGQVQKDNSGQPILSAAGQALNNAHVSLRQQGMFDPVARHQVAMQMVQNQMTQSQISAMQQQPQMQNSAADMHKQQYTDQPFAHPTNPLPPGQMPNTPVQPTANALGANGLPEHNSLGSLATALAVHKGYLQPKS
tara:strand:- start:3650 stop:4741 length:1092 start_codon:yes stop_codon:yes gene_type:complete